MRFRSGQRFAAKVVALLQSGKGLRWSGESLMPAKYGLEPFDQQVFDACASLGSSDLGSFEEIVREIDGCFHLAINTAIVLPD